MEVSLLSIILLAASTEALQLISLDAGSIEMLHTVDLARSPAIAGSPGPSGLNLLP
jgi:hypothetical protein